MLRFAISIFLSAFLLFQVQPLIAKFILPWFGGTPSVWMVCLLFFQTLLVVGYLYSHAIAHWLQPKAQVICHISLLISSVFLLPIIPDSSWKPTGSDHETARIVCILLLCVGGPYVMLASTSPLLQNWFAVSRPSQSPYWLYALSNTGSLLGLFTYPFVFEPLLPLRFQAFGWSAAYASFIVVIGTCAWDVWRRGSQTSNVVPPDDSFQCRVVAHTNSDDWRPDATTIGLWLALSACGSVVLLATTNRMCQDVASAPFLWVLPLGLYLSTFILLFGNERFYNRNLFAVALILSAAATVVLTFQELTFNLPMQVALYCGVLTVACSVCHGELVHLKPSTKYLTLFYVVVALGGALGGVFVSLVAPLIFTGYYEFNAGLVGCIGLLLLLYRRERWAGMPRNVVRKKFRTFVIFAIVLAVVSLSLMSAVSKTRPNETFLVCRRNFYGVVRVVRRSEAGSEHRRIVMVHGNTMHGVQFDSPDKRDVPTLYYERNSGVGLAIANHPEHIRKNVHFELESSDWVLAHCVATLKKMI